MTLRNDGKSGRFGDKARLYLGLIATLLTLGLVGCSGDGGGNPVNNGTGNPPGGGSGNGAGLVLGANQAWIGVDVDGDTGGYIFRADSSFLIVVKEGDQWIPAGEGTLEGTWSATGNQLTLTLSGRQSIMTYTISGNILTVTFTGDEEKVTLTLTKTNGVTVGSGGGGDNDGADLVLGANQAWTRTEDGMAFGCIFRDDRTFSITIMVGDQWILYGEKGTWSVAGSNVTVTLLGETQTGTYAISENGNRLTLTLDGETEILTKTNGVTAIDGGGDLVLGDGQAWTINMDLGGGDVYIGFIFKPDGKFYQAAYNVRGDDTWYYYDDGEWFTSGGLLICTLFGDEPMVYAVSGDSLLIPGLGVLTKTDGVYPILPPPVVSPLSKKSDAKALTSIGVGGSFLKRTTRAALSRAVGQ